MILICCLNEESKKYLLRAKNFLKVNEKINKNNTSLYRISFRVCHLQSLVGLKYSYLEIIKIDDMLNFD